MKKKAKKYYNNWIKLLKGVMAKRGGGILLTDDV